MREDTGNAISVETVLVLWRSALATPLHGPFCACCGGIPVSPADLEQDVFDYLVQRYEQSADPLLAEAARQRLSATARSLTDWLTALTRELPPAASQQILDDLANVLRGIAADRPGSFICT